MRKNNRSRLLIFALIAVLFVAAAVPAYAAMTGKDISVFTGVRIFVDGRELQPIDVKGNEVEAFIYEGTTYVPLRAVGEALGAEVSWDKESKTVYVNSEKTGNDQEARVARFDAGSGSIVYTCGPMNLESKWCAARLDGFTLIDSWVDFSDYDAEIWDYRDLSYTERVRLYDVFAIFSGMVYDSDVTDEVRGYFLCYVNFYDKEDELLRSEKIYYPVELDQHFDLKLILTVPADTVRIEVTADRPY